MGKVEFQSYCGASYTFMVKFGLSDFWDSVLGCYTDGNQV